LLGGLQGGREPRLAQEWNGMEWNGMEWNGMEWLLQPMAVSSLLGVGLSHCASRLATQTHAVTTRSVGPARSMALAMQSLGVGCLR